MKKIKFIFQICFVSFFLYSCSGLSDAGKVLRNEKVRTSDEFLVKKRQPLSVPPNFDELPQPKSQVKKRNKNESIEQKIRLGVEENTTQNKQETTTEKSIINQIQK